MTEPELPLRHIRSFVRREGRITVRSSARWKHYGRVLA